MTQAQPESPSLKPQWVMTDDALVDCCQRLTQSPAIAVDTEFMRTDTFYPLAALIQVADAEHCYLIDPLTIDDFTPLMTLWQNANVVKVMHACSEDLEVFNRFLHSLPTPMVDTQIAAGLANVGSGMGYANLLDTLMGVQLPKGETRSDWLQRPLSDDQVRYAVLDVTYLLPLYHLLREKLTQQQRWSWLQEECDRQLSAAAQPVDVDAFYPRIKLAWQLSAQQLHVLRSLSAWREATARSDDKPRNHVIHEKVLLELAREQPVDKQALSRCAGLQSRKVKAYGTALLQVINEALQVPPADYPEPLPKPLSAPQRQLLKQLKQTVNSVAEQQAIAPELLARKADLEFMVRRFSDSGEKQLPERLQGWRQPVIGDTLLAQLAA